VQRETKLRLLDFFVVPFFTGIGFVFKAAYAIGFAWWLDPWCQRKANRALLDDVQASFYSLVSDGQITHPKRTTVLPFDYASVKIVYRNALFCFTRGRGDVTVSVSPRHAPDESYELGRALAAVDGKRLSEHYLVNDLESAAKLLRPRMEALNSAFSEETYSGIRQRI
jgi:hypothetical protein